MTNFYLETDRLVLRPHLYEDVPFMVELNSDPQVTRFTGDGAISEEVAKEIVGKLSDQFDQLKMGRFLTIEKSTGDKVGWCGLSYMPEREVVDHGYRFLKGKWGLGYATESSIACLKYGFGKLNLSEITAQVDILNKASIRVLEKLHFNIVSEKQDDLGTFYNLKISKAEFEQNAP